MRSYPLVLAAVVAALCSARASAQLDVEMQKRAAVHLLGTAMQMSSAPSLNLVAIESATIIAYEAVRLDPENADAWRFLRDIALLAEREDYYEEAVRRLVELDPDDDVARLAAINLDIEKIDSLEERFVAYDRLLDPSRRAELGPAVASRLQLDVALLHQRRGDLDEFADALAESVAIDPSNRTAVAIATGFFRMNADDALAEAELLVRLVRADPTDVTSLVALGELLLEHGAYAGAERMYSMATASMRAMDAFPRDQLVADACIAQWGIGDAQAALRRVRARQQEVDEVAQAQASQAEPDLDPLQRAEYRGALDPTLATVRAAIRRQSGDAKADQDLERAIDAYQRVLESTSDDGELTPEAEAATRLEMAWVALWLGTDVDRVETMLARVEELHPINELARARFDGWLALRRGEAELALERLAACPDDDLAVLLGRGAAHKALGRRSDAAHAFLAAVRERPGTLMGVWAANELWGLLGRRLPITPEAAGLEHALSSLPVGFEQYPVSPSLAVDLWLEPTKAVFQMFEPIVVDVHIRNNSPDPLAIDSDGPIKPELLITFKSTMRELRRPELHPVVVNIGRRLRLEPREELVIPIDLRLGELGGILTADARHGAFVRPKAYVNFRITPRGAIRTALLGSQATTPMLRIEGVRVTPSWIQEALSGIRDPRELADLNRIAVLIQSSSFTLPANADPKLFQLVNVVRDATAQAYANLGGKSQAWILGATPSGTLTDQMRAWAQQSPDRTVRLIYLLYHLQGPDDPMLDPSLYADDPDLQYLAQRSVDIYEAIRAQQRLPTGNEGR